MPINKLEGIHVDAVMTIGDMKSETESDLQKLVKRLERLPDRVLCIPLYYHNYLIYFDAKIQLFNFCAFFFSVALR